VLNFHADLDEVNTPVTAEKRRNVFLAVKEILHNTVKYSGARTVRIDVTFMETLCVTITEINVAGFDAQVAMERGNGLYNMQKRMKAIGGDISFLRQNNDMTIKLTIPLESKQT
jgi:signal transduction histidine kinase